ncbi:hypothetical protein FIBSPDRAFT_748026 [Athelia psychrophila]|uniref:Defect at low temperature protein 1 n=1 Tax=Athelia psychrophila TaxID=1759441 RepID=A0A166FFQ4_9AGAM|nr:hypothetical protein FIBSPDRAFT_748026 [Fibularhizoctonia sp. CBS 109695]
MRQLWNTLSEILYLIFLSLTAGFFVLSCTLFLSQAVRTSTTQTWSHNLNALIIGASYVIVFAVSLAFCLNRRISVRRRLQRISKTYRTIGRGDVPKAVHQYISQEYARTCIVSHEVLPSDAFHEGWGRPGTQYAGVRFRRALLDTIPDIDAHAHLVIPSHPKLRPHSRMMHHFRFILPLLPQDEDGISLLHYYDSAIQLARNSARQPTEMEYQIGIESAEGIKQV